MQIIKPCVGYNFYNIQWKYLFIFKKWILIIKLNNINNNSKLLEMNY